MNECAQVGLLNVDGYYNSLLCFIDKAVEEGFISPTARHIIVSAPTPRELVKKLEVKKKFSDLDDNNEVLFFWWNSLSVYTFFRLLYEEQFVFAFSQDYIPRHERVASKVNWEMEQLGYPPKLDIARWSDDRELNLLQWKGLILGDL